MPDLFELGDLLIGVVGDPSVSREAFYEGLFPRVQQRVTPQAVDFRAVVARTNRIVFVSIVHLFLLAWSGYFVEVGIVLDFDVGFAGRMAEADDATIRGRTSRFSQGVWYRDESVCPAETGPGVFPEECTRAIVADPAQGTVEGGVDIVDSVTRVSEASFEKLKDGWADSDGEHCKTDCDGEVSKIPVIVGAVILTGIDV